jgi:hypothetical protein
VATGEAARRPAFKGNIEEKSMHGYRQYRDPATLATTEEVGVLRFPPGGGYVRLGTYRPAVLIRYKMGAKTALVRFSNGKQRRVPVTHIRVQGEVHAPVAMPNGEVRAHG